MLSYRSSAIENVLGEHDPPPSGAATPARSRKEKRVMTGERGAARGAARRQAAAVASPGNSFTERRMTRAARDLSSLVRLLPNGENLLTLANGA
jgi:hypothetical protein